MREKVSESERRMEGERENQNVREKTRGPENERENMRTRDKERKRERGRISYSPLFPTTTASFPTKSS